MSLRGAIASWNAEVEAETERLIEAGTPPFEAADKAVRIVSERRKQKVADRIDSYSKEQL